MVILKAIAINDHLRLLTVGWTICMLLSLTVGCKNESDVTARATTEEMKNAPVAPSEVRLAESAAPADLTDESGQTQQADKTVPAESSTTTDKVATDNSQKKLASPERRSTNPPETVEARKQAPRPTAEQIEAWEIPDYDKLELLACYDGFGNPFLSCLAAAADGSHFVVGGERLTLFSPKQSGPVARLMKDIPKELDHYVRAIAISADGKLVASGEKGGMLRIWNIQTRELVQAWQAYDSRVSQIAFSPNSQTLCTASYSSEVTIWDTENGKEITSFPVGDGEVNGIEFLTNDSLVASAGAVGIWDIAGRKRKRRLGNNVFGSALAYSKDRGLIAHADSDSALQLFDVQSNRRSIKLSGHYGPVDITDISPDGKILATAAQDSSIRIWEIDSGGTVQIMDCNGAPIVGLRWLADRLLVVASENGRVRIWGDREDASSHDLAINMPETDLIPDGDDRQPAYSALLKQTMEVRSFPRLAGSVSKHEQFDSIMYETTRSADEIKMFYRFVLAQSGWQEKESPAGDQRRLSFVKGSHKVVVGFPTGEMPGFLSSVPRPGGSLQYEGNYDLRWLPKHADDAVWDSYSTFGSASYRTTDDITDVEVKLLRRMHAAGWTACSRPNSSVSEEPARRSIDFVAGGLKLSISLGYGAGDPGKLFVQASSRLHNQSLPIPPDSGFIEHDASRPLDMVANTKMNLDETVEFFADAMERTGWIAREHLRHVGDDGRAWLPYIRGQQDLVIRFVEFEDGGTRILVGKPGGLSWQLAKVEPIDPKLIQNGIEAADFQLPQEAQDVDYDIDQKNIQATVQGKSPVELVSGFSKLLAEKSWQKDSPGILDEEYSFTTLKKGKSELTMRARAIGDNITELSIDGNGLLWSKPIPTPPKRISYRLWLQRNHFRANLDRLDQFWEEMRDIPPPKQPAD